MVGRILKDDIERVRAAADLYDIVSATVTLKSSGIGTFVGLCPFHDEKTPSFSVRPTLGVWHCFGCGLGGDVFKYVEQQESVGFAEAVEILADKYGIELHYENNSDMPEKQGSRRSRLLEANEAAQKFFGEQILTKEALAARKLLAGRKFSKADSLRFGCGYAPNGWDNLVRHLSSLGFTQQEMLDAGLARQGQRGIYDYFRGRLTWPIRDSTGRTLGFGARRLFDDDQIQAKYINTPDTTLYQKNRVLYGIDLAKKTIVEQRRIVVVEGYTDVMACHLAGVTNAVATCGTAFGAEHAKMVRRLISDDRLGAIQLVGPTVKKVGDQSVTSGVIFTFDGDSAGQKAAIHAFGLDGAFLSQSFVAVARENLDPCDLRIKYGNEAVVQLVTKEAKPIYDFVIDTVIREFDLRYTTGKLGAMKAVAPLIAQIRDRSQYTAYSQKAARQIGMSLSDMQREVTAQRRRLRVREEDVYAPKSYGPAGSAGPSSFPTQGTGLQSQQNLRTTRPIPASPAGAVRFMRVDDAVVETEQQFMALLIQVPQAVNPEMLSKLTSGSFYIPVFNLLFDAIKIVGLPPVQTAGSAGSPDSQNSQGLWIHNLTKEGGILLESAINELGVIALPMASSDLDAAKQYGSELMVRLLDAQYLRDIADIRNRMNSTADSAEKMQLLGSVTQLELQRKNLRDEVFGNEAQ